jgi:hypothetical protein
MSKNIQGNCADCGRLNAIEKKTGLCYDGEEKRKKKEQKEQDN